MKFKVLVFLFCCYWVWGQNQFPKLSEAVEISVLTFGPGQHLNDAFGHSGFRIKDSISNLDVVFNYGVYDFNTPNFYTKFAQGRLNYKIGVNYSQPLLNFYVNQNRSIEEQTLNLNFQQKSKLYNYLLNNYKPQNREYLYDFFYDNCATKIKEVCNEALENKIKFKTPNSITNASFRAYIHEQVYWNSWGRLGIDLALGAKIDQPTKSEDAMFLPQYIHEFFKVAEFDNNIPLVKEEKTLFKSASKPNTFDFLWSPLLVFSLLSIGILLVTRRDFKSKHRTRWLDSTIFIFTGIVGLLILLLWFATDHLTTANNYNLLWGFPLNLIMGLVVLKKNLPPWIKNYTKLLIILLILTGIHWITGIQNFPVVIAPLLCALIVRYLYLLKH